ncbi:MAG: helix-turn-helix domain-containing protein [Thaumarchaeota archaeon]|nr:helix-turn-helix domain-containing protein [Nitrososphaerota archaeon]
MAILSRMANPMSVNDVSKTFNIPLSTAYKYVTALRDAGLVVVKKSVVRDTGSKYSLFESTVKSVLVTFGEKGSVDVDVVLNNDVTEKFMRYWRRLGEA